MLWVNAALTFNCPGKEKCRGRIKPLVHNLVMITWPNFGPLFFNMGNKRYKYESKMGNMEILLSGLTSMLFMAKTKYGRVCSAFSQRSNRNSVSGQRLRCSKMWHPEFVLPTPWLAKAPNLHTGTHCLFFFPFKSGN